MSEDAQHAMASSRRRLIVAGVVLLGFGAAVAVWWQVYMVTAPEAEHTAAFPDDAEAEAVVIPVEGMVCAVCTATVRRALRGVEGVDAVTVSLAQRRAVVTYRPGVIEPGELQQRLEEATRFRIGPPEPIEGQKGVSRP